MPANGNFEELKAKVLKSLEATGVLSQIRAQLRASVLQAIDDRPSKGHKKLCEAPGVLLCTEVIGEFFEFHGLRHSLCVFQTEAQLEGDRRGRSDVAADAGLGPPAEGSSLLQQLLVSWHKESSVEDSYPVASSLARQISTGSFKSEASTAATLEKSRSSTTLDGERMQTSHSISTTTLDTSIENDMSHLEKDISHCPLANPPAPSCTSMLATQLRSSVAAGRGSWDGLQGPTDRLPPLGEPPPASLQFDGNLPSVGSRTIPAPPLCGSRENPSLTGEDVLPPKCGQASSPTSREAPRNGMVIEGERHSVSSIAPAVIADTSTGTTSGALLAGATRKSSTSNSVDKDTPLSFARSGADGSHANSHGLHTRLPPLGETPLASRDESLPKMDSRTNGLLQLKSNTSISASRARRDLPQTSGSNGKVPPVGVCGEETCTSIKGGASISDSDEEAFSEVVEDVLGSSASEDSLVGVTSDPTVPKARQSSFAEQSTTSVLDASCGADASVDSVELEKVVDYFESVIIEPFQKS